MGSVLAIIGDRKDSGLKKQLLRMADRSPHRGTILSHAEDGIVMAVQARGNDASLASVNQHVVAFHGYVGNWHRLGLPDSLGSAAERIAQAYDRLGESLLPKLRGEFALLIYDRSQQILLAARDPVGCRPLFFQRSHDRLFLASEIRQVLAGSDSPRELNRQTLISYLVHQPPADLGTLFRGVQFIAPGEVFRFGCLDATCERQTYWSLEPDSALAGLTPEEWVHELARRLQAAVARSLPEEPFGVSLSGGLDSSAVWASISKLASEGDKRAAMGRPFSLIFPGLDCDESHHISRLLTATNADGLVIDASRIRGSQHIAELLESIDTVVFPTLWFTLLVCQAAVGNGRRVMLTGQFGDHWFDMRAPRGWRARGDQFLRDALLLVPGPRLGNLLYRGLRRLVASLSASQQVRHQSMPLNGDLLSKPRASVHSVDRSIVEQKVRARLRFFQTSWVGQSWEQVAEAQQVELRHPLADPDLIELACATPSSLLDSPLIKPGLRQALVGLLPEEIRLRSDKTTFDSLVFEDRELMDLAQSPDQWSLVKQGIIDGHRLEAYYRQSLEAGAAVAPMAWLCSAELFVRHLVTDTRGSTSL